MRDLLEKMLEYTESCWLEQGFISKSGMVAVLWEGDVEEEVPDSHYIAAKEFLGKEGGRELIEPEYAEVTGDIKYAFMKSKGRTEFDATIYVIPTEAQLRTLRKLSSTADSVIIETFGPKKYFTSDSYRHFVR
ncbi:hypothetical protein GF374_03520, partial [Candidatus Woesearchaeota archaeon]|nr:hypothetical protein [Candidatus Woesearchaeota archaeon]